MLVNGLAGQVTPDRRYLVCPGGRRRRYAPAVCARSLADGSVGAAERVLKQSDPLIRAFDLSPDGSTLAYSIQEADGRLNAFLTDFPAGSRQLQVTTSGGGAPTVLGRWQGTLLSVARHAADRSPRGAVAERPITLKPLDTSGPPVQLFVDGKEPEGIILNVFDVARDRRMLTMRRTGGDKRPQPSPDSRAELARGTRPVAIVGRQRREQWMTEGTRRPHLVVRSGRSALSRLQSAHIARTGSSRDCASGTRMPDRRWEGF